MHHQHRRDRRVTLMLHPLDPNRIRVTLPHFRYPSSHRNFQGPRDPLWGTTSSFFTETRCELQDCLQIHKKKEGRCDWKHFLSVSILVCCSLTTPTLAGNATSAIRHLRKASWCSDRFGVFVSYKARDASFTTYSLWIIESFTQSACW